MEPTTILQLSKLGLTLPDSPLVNEALDFAKKHCDESIYNHVVRCAYWALIIAKRVPRFTSHPADQETVVLTAFSTTWASASQTP